MMPSLPPARKERSRGLQLALLKMARWGGSYKVWAAVALAVTMTLFARPQFDADFRAMNTISEQTAAAEKWIAQHWGNLSERIFLITQAPSLGELQQRCDTLLDAYESAVAGKALNSAFSPSMIFPGARRSQQNFEAWKTF